MIDEVISIANKAGQAILSVYDDPELSEKVDYKSDHSPLTLADKRSNEVIVTHLASLSPDIPILSEESAQAGYDIRRNWEKFWLVDPLDGTKEFINRNGEFTVNIALIEHRKPVLGVIYVPVTGCLYYSAESVAIKDQWGNQEILKVRNANKNRIAVRSKSHASPEEDQVLDRYAVEKFISVGSSLKFCMVAEGKADLYYRHGPTMEWDTGAGQAILEAAGGRMYHGNDEGIPFTYNKENLLNGSFLCLGFN